MSRRGHENDRSRPVASFSELFCSDTVQCFVKLLAPAHMAQINKRAKKEISDMREAPISTTKAKTRKPSFGVLFFAAMLAAGIPSALSAEEVTPAPTLSTSISITMVAAITSPRGWELLRLRLVGFSGISTGPARSSLAAMPGRNARRPQAAPAKRLPCRHRGRSLRSHASSAVLSLRLSEVQPKMPRNG